MKKLAFLLSVFLVFNSCYKDDIDDLNKKYDELKKEQERQAELLATYQALLEAFENKLTISAITNVENGYKIVFSNGTELLIRNGNDGHTPVITLGDNGNWFIDGVDTGKAAAGQDGLSPVLSIVDGYWHLNDVNTGVKAEGTDGKNAPAIVSIVDFGGTITFYMSDGSVITVGKTETIGLYVLYESTMGEGNGQLVYFDYFAADNTFVCNNDKGSQDCGEMPNDLMIYGSKMYCAITGDDIEGGLVRVINPITGQTIRDIIITYESDVMQPRRLTAHDGKVYVTLYSGAVARIDTALYTTDVIQLSGTYSEGICAYGNNLYICNSGQGSGNTISVVGTGLFTEIKAITVPHNPVNIVYAGNGELYFNTASVSSGPAAGELSNLHVLNVATGQVIYTFGEEAESIAAGKGCVYSVATDWQTSYGVVKKISVADRSVYNFTEDVLLPYKLSVNPLTREVFLTQNMGQAVYRYSEDGIYIETLFAGQEAAPQNGAAVVFVNVVK